MTALTSQTGVTAWVASNLRAVLSGAVNIEAAYAVAFLTCASHRRTLTLTHADGTIGIPVHVLLLRRAIRAWQKKRIMAAQISRAGVVGGARPILPGLADPRAGMTITTETQVRSPLS